MHAERFEHLITRIRLQSKFHPLIESGAIIHAFVGEERPPAASVLALVRKTFENTQAAQLTISPEFTTCNACSRHSSSKRGSSVCTTGSSSTSTFTQYPTSEMSRCFRSTGLGHATSA